MRHAIHMTVSRDIETRIQGRGRFQFIPRNVADVDHDAYILATITYQGYGGSIVPRNDKTHPHDIFNELRQFSSRAHLRIGALVDALLNKQLRTVRPNDLLTEILRRAD